MKAELTQREGKIHYDVMEFIDPRVQVHGECRSIDLPILLHSMNPDGSISSRIPWNCSEVYVKTDAKWQPSSTTTGRSLRARDCDIPIHNWMPLF